MAPSKIGSTNRGSTALKTCVAPTSRASAVDRTGIRRVDLGRPEARLARVPGGHRGDGALGAGDVVVGDDPRLEEGTFGGDAGGGVTDAAGTDHEDVHGEPLCGRVRPRPAGARVGRTWADDDDDEGDEEHQRADDVDLHRSTALGGPPDVHREGDRARARVEVGDDVVVEAEREGEQRTGEDAGCRQREGDPQERLGRVGPEVGRRLLEPRVEGRHPRLDGDDDERDAEHDVGDGDRQRRRTGTPIMRNSVSRLEPMTTSGVAIGMKISRLVARARPEPVAAQREGDHRAEHGGDERRDEPDPQGQAERLADALGAARVGPRLRRRTPSTCSCSGRPGR